jgi:hypothetical protein
LILFSKAVVSYVFKDKAALILLYVLAHLSYMPVLVVVKALCNNAVFVKRFAIIKIVILN